jgi:hypothetical protein
MMMVMMVMIRLLMMMVMMRIVIPEAGSTNAPHMADVLTSQIWWAFTNALDACAGSRARRRTDRPLID